MMFLLRVLVAVEALYDPAIDKRIENMENCPFQKMHDR
jgi:hypothetical protein